MGTEFDTFLAGIFIGCVITIIVMGLLGVFSEDRELGQAICEKEYNMDFDNYNNKELKCKPKERKAEIAYDGIIVQIGE